MNKKIPTKNSLLRADNTRIDLLYHRVTEHIDKARLYVQKTIDVEMVKSYWLIGRDIVEEEQQGKKRAEYGSLLLSVLSERLSKNYGRGFGIST